MKKQWKFALIIACAAAMVLAGCGGEETHELTLEGVKEAYSTVVQATKIEESIEIKSGALVQYTEEKVYTPSGNTYTVTGSTKKLNTLDASEAYTAAEIEAYTVNKAEAFTGTIGLEDANVEDVTVEGNTLTVTVKAGKEKDFFKLEAVENVTAMKAVFRVNEAAQDDAAATLGGIVITYTTGTSTVTVSITFTYSS